MKKEMTVKTGDSGSFSVRSRFRSFRYAYAGLNAFFSTQHNSIIHLFATIAVLMASVFFRIDKTEIFAIIFSVGLVWSSELFNTAVEKLADLVSQEFDPRIKFIKDVSAAAVLLSSLAALIVGVIIFLPKILS
ncbi:MAG TPA: diacylglycerol kinase family protein [Chitinophagaceae bacterium]|jgi:diacylglycerol kinase